MFKKLVVSEIDESSNQMIGRKRNMLYHIYESVIQKFDSEKGGKLKNKNVQLTKADTTIWSLQNKVEDYVHPWFIKHMKMFRNKSKSVLLVAPDPVKRKKSAKKNKFMAFKPLDTDMYKV
jgi:hypothetical protein